VIDLKAIQEESEAWRVRNFGDAPLERRGLVLSEETGEVARAIVKGAEKVRTDYGNLSDELGDVIIAACSVASKAGLDIEACLALRWNEVGQREYPKG